MLLDSDGKADVIRQVAIRFRATHDDFIETGTGFGDLPFRLADEFDRIVTIEKMEDHYRRSRDRLADFENVKCLHGDSADLLDEVLDGIGRPCVIWLDAHVDTVNPHQAFSALGAELNILAQAEHDHVILIDDARLCSGVKGWPTVEGIGFWANRTGYTMYGPDNDIITLVR
jgi:hypothetical protein